MRARLVEDLNFEKGRDPKRSLDIGVTVENRDPRKMEGNFKKAFPEVQHTHIGEQHLHAPGGPHPSWKTITVALHNPKDGISVDKRKEKYLNWFKQYTDYDQFEIDSAFDRYWHPWGDESKPQQYEQQFTFLMRHKDYFNESYNFERGQDPKKSLQVGRASRVNYFRDNLEGISYKKYIEEVEDFPWNQGKDILRVAAKLLDIPEKDVQIAVEYDNEPLTTARIEEHIECHEWQYDLDETIGDFDLIKTETGELYVFPAGEQEDPYAILGSPF